MLATSYRNSVVRLPVLLLALSAFSAAAAVAAGGRVLEPLPRPHCFVGIDPIQLLGPGLQGALECRPVSRIGLVATGGMGEDPEDSDLEGAKIRKVGGQLRLYVPTPMRSESFAVAGSEYVSLTEGGDWNRMEYSAGGGGRYTTVEGFVIDATLRAYIQDHMPFDGDTFIDGVGLRLNFLLGWSFL
jgi:hypothetical protein